MDLSINIFFFQNPNQTIQLKMTFFKTIIIQINTFNIQISEMD
jgi:hypothetical protein